MLCATTIQRCSLIELSPSTGTTTTRPLIPNEPTMIDADPSVRGGPIIVSKKRGFREPCVASIFDVTARSPR
jgi:hypothetical protein